MTRLRDLILSDEHFEIALGIFKVGVEKREPPTEALRKAMIYFAMLHEPTPPEKWSHDQRIANANRLMREEIAPSLPITDGAVLLMFERRVGGLLTYISNCDRRDCREMLREVLAKWDADELAKGTTG